MALVTGKRNGKEIDATVTVAKKVTMSAVSTVNENSEEVELQIARFFFESGIPLHAMQSDEFQRMIEAIAECGPGYVPPTPEQLGGCLLKERVSEIKESIEEHKIWWKKQGCSILIDCRTNRWTEKTICAFFVSCGAKGIVFVKSVDATEICKSVDRVFKMVDEVVEEIGEENVVQVVTNDLENYKVVGKLLMEKRKRLWWTPCMAHCIGLMLEDFEEKLKVHKETISNGKVITTYVYSRNFTIALLHSFSKGKDLVKPTVNKSATSYLTLGCLRDNKKTLATMFTSEQWKSSYYAGTKSGKNVVSLVMDGKFWENVEVCLKAANPLIKVLCLVTSDEKPAMGFIYDEMKQAKKKIQRAFKGIKRLYMPLLDIIDGRWDNELFRPLHATAYYLNPKFHYSPKFTVDVDVKFGLYGCLSKMVPDKAEATKVDLQLEDFKHARKFFGSDFAKAALETKNPSQWWDSYGFECQEIQNFAVRILSLACCSSGCVRNWSALDKLHRKRRNRLKQKQMRDVVFVMSNSKLAKRNEARKAVEYTMDDLSSDDEWITEKDDVFYDEEELALDSLYSFAPIGNDYIKDQAGKDVFGDGNEFGDGLHDEDGASNATGYFLDGESDDMEDEDYDDDHDIDYDDDHDVDM